MKYYEEQSLAHFGIKGQKWGVRRFQNEDGALTDAGKRRYGEAGNGIVSRQDRKKPWYVKDESLPKAVKHPGTIIERSEGNKDFEIRGLFGKKKEKQNKFAELEPGKKITEASDEALTKRKERVDKLAKQNRVQSIVQAVTGVSMIAAGRYMTKKYPGGWGQLLKLGGIGYTLGTGVGYVLGEGTTAYAKNLLSKEEE